jgi:transcriptional regulator with XRE-family HTH domain
MNATKAESRAYFRALGVHIGVLRKKQGMTQAELARALGVSQQTIFAYELGDRRVSVFVLAKLARIFQMPVETLIGFTYPPVNARRRLSPAGMGHAQRFQQLSKTQQHFVKRIIEVLLEGNTSRPALTGKMNMSLPPP